MARVEGIAGQGDDKVVLTIRRIVAYVVLVLLVFISLFPFWLLFVNASRPAHQIGITVIPEDKLIDNFKGLFTEDFQRYYGSFVKSFVNSILIAVSTTALSVYFSALTAYAIHVYDFKLKKAIHTFILLVMMVPTQASAIGLYRMLGDMNLLNSYIPLIVPGIAAPAVYFFMIQYMASSLPLDIVEAARIDGSGEFRTFNSLILPILKPAIAVQGIFAFVASWNNLFLPQMIITEQEKRTIPLVVQAIKANIETNPSATNVGLMNMYMVIAILPVVVVYLILSKYIIRGIALGAVKG